MQLKKTKLQGESESNYQLKTNKWVKQTSAIAALPSFSEQWQDAILNFTCNQHDDNLASNGQNCGLTPE